MSWVLHAVPQYKGSQPRFLHVFEKVTIIKWIEGEMTKIIFKEGEGHMSEVNTYHSYGLRIAL